jgi:hypothetical protein
LLEILVLLTQIRHFAAVGFPLAVTFETLLSFCQGVDPAKAGNLSAGGGLWAVDLLFNFGFGMPNPHVGKVDIIRTP